MKSIIAKFKIVISKLHAIYCIVRIYTYTHLIKFTLNFVLCIQQNSDNLLSLTELKEWMHSNVCHLCFMLYMCVCVYFLNLSWNRLIFLCLTWLAFLLSILIIMLMVTKYHIKKLKSRLIDKGSYHVSGH